MPREGVGPDFATISIREPKWLAEVRTLQTWKTKSRWNQSTSPEKWHFERTGHLCLIRVCHVWFFLGRIPLLVGLQDTTHLENVLSPLSGETLVGAV